MSKMIEEIKIFSKATDPIYIGTGGYTIGRVDNTIVRDPLNRVPKIPGSSIAGTWRFYSALYFQGKWKDLKHMWSKFKEKEHLITSYIGSYIDYLKGKGYHIDENEENLKKNLKNVDFRKLILKLRHIFWNNGQKDWYVFWEDFWNYFEKYKEQQKEQDSEIESILDKIYENKEIIEYSIYSTIYCAGQDELPQEEIKEEEIKEDTIKGHCGRCIVCKSFGYSKNNNSWQGTLFFSDLEIILFPVYTRDGTKFITTKEKLKYLTDNAEKNNTDDKIEYAYEYDESGDYCINLGWLNIKVKKSEDVKEVYKIEDCEFKLTIRAEDIVIVPDKIFNQVVNANLEVRTSVSIDPITGTAKDGGLFTSEAIPRGTIFYGNIRIFDKSIFDKGILPTIGDIKNMLLNSKCYFETLGIGGLTTRGFGRMKVVLNNEESNGKEGAQNNDRK